MVVVATITFVAATRPAVHEGLELHEIVARLSELAEAKIGQLTFYFASQKLKALATEVEAFSDFIVREKFQQKRNLDISHKNLLYEAGVLMSAAFGPGYQQVGTDYSRLDPRPPIYRFFKQPELPEDKHFLADAMLSPVANTTFSALLMLSS